MRYKNAAEVLPTHLLEALQQYAEGTVIYVPKTSDRVGWGHQTGIRHELDLRNEAIKREYFQCKNLKTVAQKYHLSESSVKKIVYEKE